MPNTHFDWAAHSLGQQKAGRHPVVPTPSNWGNGSPDLLYTRRVHPGNSIPVRLRGVVLGF